MMTKKQTSKFQVIRYIPAFVLSGILFYGLCCNIPVKATEFIKPELPEIQQHSQTPKEKITVKGSDKDAQAPVFLENDGNVFSWLQKKMKYPEKAIKEKKTGKVLVNFVIDKEGNVTNPRIIRSVDPELDAEALRVIRQMPKWKPGIKDGKPIEVSMNIPFTFMLSKTDGTPVKVTPPIKPTIVEVKER